MERLQIDEGIKGLIRQLWKHEYKTIFSCEGNCGKRYVVFKGHGDGWLEKNSEKYGLKKTENGKCCSSFSPSPAMIACPYCGAGINGATFYSN